MLQAPPDILRLFANSVSDLSPPQSSIPGYLQECVSCMIAIGPRILLLSLYRLLEYIYDPFKFITSFHLVLPDPAGI